jgi:hypothetical protein
MSMHMMSPAFTTTGKSKAKRKFRNSAEAAKARKNAESWKQLLEKWDVKPTVKKTNAKYVNPADAILRERSNRSIPSLDTGIGTVTKKEPLQYTGDEMIGIGQMHKSNAVPIFKQEDAEDLAKMRR